MGRIVPTTFEVWLRATTLVLGVKSGFKVLGGPGVIADSQVSSKDGVAMRRLIPTGRNHVLV